MENDRNKWNERYGGKGFFFSLTPSKLLAESLDLVLAQVQGRRALDIACGEGRNAIFLAQNGFEVTAVDIAELGLERGRVRAAGLGVRVEFVQADLEDWEVPGPYDLILDFNFLLRPLIPMLVEALSPGALLIMETILESPGLQGEHNPLFLLQSGELEQLFRGLPGTILLLEEEPAQETPVARIIFRRS
jgi:tellurite methyltransferase